MKKQTGTNHPKLGYKHYAGRVACGLALNLSDNFGRIQAEGDSSGRRGEKGMLTDDELRAFLKALGLRIKHLRKTKGIRLRDIMTCTGYYDAQWRKYEAGGGLTVQSLLRITLALDVSIDALFDGLGAWPKQSVAQILDSKAAVQKAPAKKPTVGVKNAAKRSPRRAASGQTDVSESGTK